MKETVYKELEKLQEKLNTAINKKVEFEQKKITIEEILEEMKRKNNLLVELINKNKWSCF